MTHFRELFKESGKEEKYLCAYMLKGKDVALTIEAVKIEEVIGDKGRKEKLPVLYFKGKDKGMVLNKTNAKMIAKLHGKDSDGWTGKEVIIYPTEVSFGQEMVEAIRVRYEFN